MTLQEMFDRAYLGVLGQGQRCVRPSRYGGTNCCYSHDGMHCAVGWFVPEDMTNRWSTFAFYDGGATDHAIWEMFVRDDLDHLGIDTDEATIAFISKLQSAHDCARDDEGNDDMALFASAMAAIAAEYGLTIPEGASA